MSRKSCGTHCPFSSPQCFFCAHQVFHDLGDDLVLAPQLVFQGRHFTFGFAGQPGGRAVAFKSGATLLEKRLLPLVEHRRVDVFGLADLGNRAALEQMQAQNTHLIRRAVVTAGGGGFGLGRFCLVHATGFLSGLPVA